MLLEEVAQGGVVDSTHQVWYFIPVFSFLIFSRLVVYIFEVQLIVFFPCHMPIVQLTINSFFLSALWST
jgi:hypothetical protein